MIGKLTVFAFILAVLTGCNLPMQRQQADDQNLDRTIKDVNSKSKHWKVQRVGGQRQAPPDQVKRQDSDTIPSEADDVGEDDVGKSERPSQVNGSSGLSSKVLGPAGEDDKSGSPIRAHDMQTRRQSGHHKW